MCGIVGIFDTRGRGEPDRQLLRNMMQALLHRGPDEGGEHFEPGVALGHRRLAIIDLSTGQQPLANEDGSVIIIFNGEIYNYPPLVRELSDAGHRFRTHSDTEVIVHAWEEWGERCVDRLNGMFAFAIWDRNRETLFLARDRLGKKPLYYSLLPGGELLFASELKALLVDPRVSRRLDPTAVEDYLALGYVPDPKCILANVSKLAPGHTLMIKRGEPLATPRRYWNLSFNGHAPRDEGAVAEELVARLREATRIRLMSEVPLGAFLSGGVDSSAVVAMMAGLSADPVNTCSISFGDPEYNEAAYAKVVADQYHTRHHVEQVEVDDYDLLDTLVKVYDEPFADSSAIPTYRVCQLARKRVTVALSGDGGDETFAGYRRYRWHMREEHLRRLLPQALRGPLFGALGAVYPKLDWAPRPLRAKSTFQALARDSMAAYFHSVSFTPDYLRLGLYSADFLRQLNGYRALDTFARHCADAPTDHPLSFVQYLDFMTYLPGDILVKVDRASMAHSLEVRGPILDYTLVEWAASLPADLKLRAGEGKAIFKDSLRGFLPTDIMYRPKMGFAVPLARWLRGPLRERMQRALLEGSLAEAGIFEPAPLRRLVSQHINGTRDHSASLWALLMFEGFLRLRLAG
jgi:asparagine synthase (glutamine-hydrolysing)